MCQVRNKTAISASLSLSLYLLLCLFLGKKTGTSGAFSLTFELFSSSKFSKSQYSQGLRGLVPNMSHSYYAVFILCPKHIMPYSYYALNILCPKHIMTHSYYALTILCPKHIMPYSYYAVFILCRIHIMT